MSDILPNMLIDLPALGADEGVWDDKINADFRLVDAHDHTADKGARITPAAINVNADLPFGGFFISALGKVSFTAIAAPSTGARALFVNSADNELYWRTNAGTNVKLTSGTTINTSLVGGIAGDYAAVGAEVAYDDANDRYTFKQQGTKPWARIASGPLRIFEFNTTESVYVELIAPSGLASSYTITLPLIAPAAAAFLQMSTAGVILASNSITTAIVTTSTVTGSDFRYTSGQNIQVTAAMMSPDGSSQTKVLGGTSAGHISWSLGNNTAKLTIPVPVRSGDTITSFVVYLNKTTNTSTTIAARMYRVSTVGGTVEVETALGSLQTTNANAPGAVQLTDNSLAEPVGATVMYHIIVGYTALVSFSDHVLKAEITVTRA